MKNQLELIPAGFATEARRYAQFHISRGHTFATAANAVLAIRQFATELPDRTPKTVTPDDITRIIELMRRDRKTSSAHTFATHVQAFLNWCYDGELPTNLKRALKVKKAAPPERRPITEAEFAALLQGIEESPVIKERIRAKARALVWVLWDSGMRLGEILALRRESVIIAADGCATLSLPSDAKGLKTGPRTIYVYESAEYIAAWLAAHPSKDPKAPLFPATYTPTYPMLNAAVTKMLNLLTKRMKIRHIHAHLFRHTRATRAAEAGWNEFEMNAYFGWIGGSRMASHYVHLAQLHLRERVKQDFEGRTRRPAPSYGASAEVVDLLAQLLQALKERDESLPRAR